MLKKPRNARFGRQNQLNRFQFVRGRFCAFQRRPISITATLYPFSTNRCAVTLPPNPEPITMKSKSNWRSWSFTRHPVVASTCKRVSCLDATPAIYSRCSPKATPFGDSRHAQAENGAPWRMRPVSCPKWHLDVQFRCTPRVAICEFRLLCWRGVLHLRRYCRTLHRGGTAHNPTR